MCRRFARVGTSGNGSCWKQSFFKLLFGYAQPTLAYYRGYSLTHSLNAFLQFWPESHRKLRNKVGSLSPTECLVGFETRTFRFWLQRLNPLGHLPSLICHLPSVNRSAKTIHYHHHLHYHHHHYHQLTTGIQ